MFEIMESISKYLDLVKIIKPKDRVLIIADNEGRSMWIGELTMNVVSKKGNEAVLVIINPPQYKSQEPPKCVAEAMKNVEAVIRVTDEKAPLVHTSARAEATAKGVKYCLLKLNELEFDVSEADLKAIIERTEKLAKILANTEVAKVTTPRGTSVTMKLKGHPGLPAHCMGLMATEPYYAEAAIPPIEGTMEGTIVVDVAFVDWNYLLREPITMIIKKGRVVDLKGPKQEVDKLNEIIKNHKNADNIAELGIGTSHCVPLPMYGNRRDVARIGTVHFALGRNNDFGGDTISDIHMDCLMDNVYVELDGKPVLKDGKLLI